VVVKLIYVLPEGGPTVAEAVRALGEAGIECQGGYAPLHREIGVPAEVPLTEAVWRRVLCVPVDVPSRSRALRRIRRVLAVGAVPETRPPLGSGDPAS
jgi:hypothetical protein